jgi:hypothetical protein
MQLSKWIEGLKAAFKAHQGYFYVVVITFFTVILLLEGKYNLKVQSLNDLHLAEIQALNTVHTQKLTKALEKQRQELLEPELFKPTMTLSDNQNALCLAIALYGEERMGSELDMVMIGQAITMRAMDEDWRESNACSVIRASYDNGKTLQYSSMKPFQGAIEDIVWGRINTYTPKSALNDAAERRAWEKTLHVARGIVNGDYPLMTVGNHFIALAALKTVPDWAKLLRPVNVTSGHVIFVDYEIRDGKKIRYTKDKPFNQANFNKDDWEFDITDARKLNGNVESILSE